jgi:hypothetical protein
MHVSNQLSFTELRPLPQTRDLHPVLSGIIRRVSLIASITFLNTCAGLFFGLANIGLTVTTGGVGGAVLGVTAGLGMSILMRIPTNLESYRVETLEQVQGVTTAQKSYKALDVLKDFFYYPLTALSRPYDLHLLYHCLATVGAHLDLSRADLKEVWVTFLKNIHAKRLQIPGSDVHIFDSAPLLSRLEEKQPPLSVHWYNSWWARASDLQDIAEISRVCFGKSLAFTTERLKQTLGKFQPSGLCMVKNSQTKRVIGYAWYYTEDGVVKIPEIARRPEAALLNIGATLLKEIVSKQKPGTPIQIVVQKGNPFLGTLQERWQFKPKQTLPDYFPSSREDGELLELNLP